MSGFTWLWIMLALFIIVSGAMVLIILVQRPQGGGLAGAFGGAGGTGADSVFGGRVGDALSWATVGAFVLYLILALGMNMVDDVVAPKAAPPKDTTAQTQPGTPAPDAGTMPQPAPSGDTPAPQGTTPEQSPGTPAPTPAGTSPDSTQPQPKSDGQPE